MPLGAPTMNVEVTAQWEPVQHHSCSQPLSRSAATKRLLESTARETMAEGSHPKHRTTSTRSGGARWAADAAAAAGPCLRLPDDTDFAFDSLDECSFFRES